jgi:hypothetical protein
MRKEGLVTSIGIGWMQNVVIFQAVLLTCRPVHENAISPDV